MFGLFPRKKATLVAPAPVKPRSLVDEVRALHDRGKVEGTLLAERESSLKASLDNVRMDKAQTESITDGLAKLLG